MNLDEDIIKKDLHDLLTHFFKQTYSASGSDQHAGRILDRCVDLFLKDYDISVLSNKNGDLCDHYPRKIIIIESEIHTHSSLDRSLKINKTSELRSLFVKSRLARCRSRFVVPVISFEGKNICRSATLSSFAEIVGRSSLNFLFSSSVFPEDELSKTSGNEWDLNKSRGFDIQLLKALRVKYIFDLMLENKKVKYGVRVTSSEKIDKENRYASFSICSVPYPGCEFFTVLKSKGHVPHQVYFDWKQDYVDADLNLPLEIEVSTDINWERYQRWNLATLTGNYFLLLLKTIVNRDQGVLVHCVSGWDRTPLFISLLRLSLWADGQVHQSLNALEILYLTIAYDWLLFGHDLNERMQRDEEVFFFCFHFLRYITSDTYSIWTHKRSDSSTKLQDGHNLNTETQHKNTGVQAEDDVTTNNGCCSTLPYNSTSHSFFIGESHDDNNTLLSCEENQATYQPASNGSIPVPVPTNGSLDNRKKVPQQGSVAGSWQMISAPASYCSSTSSSLKTTNNKHSLSSCEEIQEDSVRCVKLEAVRQLFLTVYEDVLSRSSPSSSNGTLFKIIDQMTDKLKSRWTKAE